MDNFRVARYLRKYQIILRALVSMGEVESYFIADAIVTINRKSISPNPSSNQNRVRFLGCEQEVAVKIIEEILEIYRTESIPRIFFILHPCPQLSEISSWLEEMGFMKFEGASYPTLLRQSVRMEPHESILSVQKLSPDMFLEHRQEINKIFQEKTDMEGFIKLLNHVEFHYFGAFHGDELVACAGLWIHQNFGYLNSAATAIEFRNLGAQSSLITARINHAAVVGCEWLCSETSYLPSISYENLRRKGFGVVYEKVVYAYDFSYGTGL